MRLIDADTLIKDLSYLYTKNHIPIDMKAKEVLTTVMQQPTAYDVDKVVAELKRKKFIEEETILSDVHQGFNAGLSIAIQIVKGGGVDGN